MRGYFTAVILPKWAWKSWVATKDNGGMIGTTVICTATAVGMGLASIPPGPATKVAKVLVSGLACTAATAAVSLTASAVSYLQVQDGAVQAKSIAATRSRPAPCAVQAKSTAATRSPTRAAPVPS